jgi:hypothetical protein
MRRQQSTTQYKQMKVTLKKERREKCACHKRKEGANIKRGELKTRKVLKNNKTRKQNEWGGVECFFELFNSRK